MRLSKKSDYALRALIGLARWARSQPMSMRTLAALNDVPERFMQQIMMDLKAQGWVISTAGRDGGYKLGLPPEELTMGQVVRHFDGVLAPIGCVSVANPERCSQKPGCPFRRVLLEVRNHTAALLDRTTLAEIALGDPCGPGKAPRQEFTGGDGI